MNTLKRSVGWHSEFGHYTHQSKGELRKCRTDIGTLRVDQPLILKRNGIVYLQMYAAPHGLRRVRRWSIPRIVPGACAGGSDLRREPVTRQHHTLFGFLD